MVTGQLGNPDQINVPHALVGRRVGMFQVTQDSAQILRLSARNPLLLFFLVASLIAMVAGLAWVIAGPEPRGAADTFRNAAKALSLWVFLIGFILSGFHLWSLGLSYTFDGTARSMRKRRLLRVKKYKADQLQGVALALSHHGPWEMLVLAVQGSHSVETILTAPSNSKAIDVVPVAIRIAQLLDVAVYRVGVPHQSGEELRAALDAIGPSMSPGDGHDLQINCPVCGLQESAAVSYHLREHSHGITHTTAWVRCLNCKTDLYSSLSPEQLRGMSAKELEEFVVFRLSLIVRFFGILAVATALLPFLGFVIGLIALLVTWRTNAWPKQTSRIGFVIASIGSTAAMIAILKTK